MTAVAGDGFALVDVELGPLAVELGLRDVPTVCQSGDVRRRSQSMGGINVRIATSAYQEGRGACLLTPETC